MVRDDAPRLKRCIESARKAVDEVVVLDTGSKDDSVEVAKAAGAKVSEIEWPGSFSVGLNTLLDRVETDWVLRLDSDEWFELDARQPLLKAMSRKDAYGYKLVRRDIRPDGRFGEIAVFRLWRNDPRLRYEGLVHENIGNPGIEAAFPNMLLGNLSLWFWHDGYAKGSEEKIRRNLALLEKELADRPNQPYYQAMRAIMFRDLGDPRSLPEMERVARAEVEKPEPSTKMLAGLFLAFLEDLPDARLREPWVQRIVDRAWEWFGSYPGVLWAVGIAQTRRHDWREALKALLKLEELAETGRYDRSLSFDPSILGPHLWNALGYAAQQAGRFDICERCARRLQAGR